LELRGLKQAVDDEYVNDAVVTVTVKDECGDIVSGQTWPASMVYVTGSNGDYRLILLNTLQVKSGKKYFAEISANGSASEIGFWKYQFRPKTRQ